MNPEEYANLMRIEKHHWFYRGKRELVRRWLGRAGAPGPADLLVDCGAGTGLFAEEMRAGCRVLAVDDHDESLELARAAFPRLEVRRGSCTALPVGDGEASCVTALDVIEHVADDAAAIGEFVRILRPGGLLVITVPAFQSLWSDWDLALHHQRRYNRAELRAKLTRPDLQILDQRFVNGLVFPLVWWIRRARRANPAGVASAAPTRRSEDRVPPGPLNAGLRHWFVWEGTQGIVRLPFGVGQLAVARKL